MGWDFRGLGSTGFNSLQELGPVLTHNHWKPTLAAGTLSTATSIVWDFVRVTVALHKHH